MPLYEYECDACGQRFEVIQKFSDPYAEVCTKCGKGPIRRLFSSPAIQFKGSGWYVTDYAQKGKSDGGKGKSDGGSSSKTETTTDSGTKSESTSTSDTASAPSSPAAPAPSSGGKKD